MGELFAGKGQGTVKPEELGDIPPDAVEPEVFGARAFLTIINHKGEDTAGWLLEAGKGTKEGAGLCKGKLVSVIFIEGKVTVTDIGNGRVYGNVVEVLLAGIGREGIYAIKLIPVHKLVFA